MRSLGVDVGSRRTGVAMSDPQGIFALPLTVIEHDSYDRVLGDIARLVEEYEIQRVVVGLPYSLNGDLGRQATEVKAFAERLSRLTEADIQLWDERLSTVAADRLMDEAGTRRRKRKGHRDAIAAAVILQGFLDSQVQSSPIT
ncbi:MAG: Holliday junction resolvase RuvX [Chloroflexi bacterium]|nr:Holliday junction resolvase RuvX [Chloroflexota bacterium]